MTAPERSWAGKLKDKYFGKLDPKTHDAGDELVDLPAENAVRVIDGITALAARAVPVGDPQVDCSTASPKAADDAPADPGMYFCSTSHDPPKKAKGEKAPPKGGGLFFCSTQDPDDAQAAEPILDMAVDRDASPSSWAAAWPTTRSTNSHVRT